MKKNSICTGVENQDGQVAIFVVLVVVSMLLFMALFLVNMTTKQTKNLRSSLNSVQAYYYADMGAEKMLRGIRQGTYDINLFNVGDEIISMPISTSPDASYSIRRVVSSAGSLEIKASGFYSETSRAVKLSW